jgi:hypothetical protein
MSGTQVQNISAGVLTAILAEPPGGQFSLFLGAGCSVTSGVPTASSILRDAKRILYRAQTREEGTDADIDDWLLAEGLLQNPNTAYYEAIEAIRPTQRLRRQFLESYFLDKTPSPAYSLLARLVSQGLFGTIFTTNFDDLFERRLRERGIARVVTYDEQARDLEVGSATPTLYKLHGDFLFDRMANTIEECSMLGPWEAEKLRHAVANSGLIVAGYSGADQSVMSILTDEAARRPPPLGLYWLTRPGSDLAPLAEQLLEMNGCFSVEVDGFDEFVADLHAATGVTQRIRPRIATDHRGAQFVVHPDGLAHLLARLETAVRAHERTIVALTGLPGVGKTTAAAEVFSERTSSFQARVLISGRDSEVSATSILEECVRQGVIDLGTARSDAERRSAVLEQLAETATMIFIDNADSINDEALELVGQIPLPSRVLVTIREAERLRRLGISTTEIHHTGLSDSEMRELLGALCEANPVLRQKYRQATPAEVDDCLVVARGWPQALSLMLAHLQNSLLHFGDLGAYLDEGSLYERLLDDLIDSLEAPTREVLVAAASFPVSFTPEGLAAVTKSDLASQSERISLLQHVHLVAEPVPGRFVLAHPLISTYAARQLAQSRHGVAMIAIAERHIDQWSDEYGGQPTADWGNFAQLDREWENARIRVSILLGGGELPAATGLFRRLFSYVVERGYWLYAEEICRTALSLSLRRTQRADWLIWLSWIEYYLNEDPAASAARADEALELPPIRLTQRFEANRRSLLAHARLGNREVAESRYLEARAIAQRWRRNSHERIDLHNSRGLALLDLSRVSSTVLVDASDAVEEFLTAEDLSKSRGDPNTREIAVAQLGRGRALLALGQPDQALAVVQDGCDLAAAVGWLRGIAEGNALLASIAKEAGASGLWESAQAIAVSIHTRLRTAAEVRSD